MVTVTAATWIVLVIWMWREFHTLPSAEALADDRKVRPPLPIDLYRNLATSFGELIFMIVILWPGSAKRYVGRAAIALLAMIAWFIATVPLDLNQMEWLHRRWLALMVVLLLVVLIVYPIATRGRRVEAQI